MLSRFYRTWLSICWQVLIRPAELALDREVRPASQNSYGFHVQRVFQRLYSQAQSRAVLDRCCEKNVDHLI